MTRRIGEPMTRSGHCAYPATLVLDPDGEGYSETPASHERCALDSCTCECHEPCVCDTPFTCMADHDA